MDVELTAGSTEGKTQETLQESDRDIKNYIVSGHSRQAETVTEARGSEKDSKNEDEREDES